MGFGGFWEKEDLLGVVEALEVVVAEEGAVLGLAAAGHALAEVRPEVVAPPLVPRYPPPGRHPPPNPPPPLLCFFSLSFSF